MCSESFSGGGTPKATVPVPINPYKPSQALDQYSQWPYGDPPTPPCLVPSTVSFVCFSRGVTMLHVNCVGNLAAIFDSPLLCLLYPTYQQGCLSFYSCHRFARLDLPSPEPGPCQWVFLPSAPPYLIHPLMDSTAFMECLLWSGPPLLLTGLTGLSPECPKFYLYKMWKCSTHFPVQSASIYSPLDQGQVLDGILPRVGVKAPFEPPDRAWVPPSWAPCSFLTWSCWTTALTMRGKQAAESEATSPTSWQQERSLRCAFQWLVCGYEKFVIREWPEKVGWDIRQEGKWLLWSL